MVPCLTVNAIFLLKFFVQEYIYTTEHTINNSLNRIYATLAESTLHSSKYRPVYAYKNHYKNGFGVHVVVECLSGFGKCFRGNACLH